MTISSHPIVFTLLATICLPACNDSNQTSPDLLITQVSQLNQVQGLWHKKAYGEIIAIGNDRVKRYQFNSKACLLLQDDSYQTALQNQIDSLRLKNGTLLAVTEKGRPIADSFAKMAELPAACTAPLTVQQQNSPSQVFEYFWHTFHDYYAFFTLRNLNWQQQYQRYAPQIHDGMSDEALFAVLAEMVDPLQDAHISLESDFKSFTAFKPAPLLRSATAIAQSELSADDAPDTESVVRQMLAAASHIAAGYLTPQSLRTFPAEGDEKTLLWGITPDNAGILVINNMAKFQQNPAATEVEQLQAAEAMLDKVFSELSGTDGLIVDIRHNLGGDLFIAQAIANRFASSDQLVATWQANNRWGQGEAATLSLSRHPRPYTKPVYLLTSELTMSAGGIGNPTA
ncbi:S41 family peptidase [Pseudomonas aeruginosa]|uniref:S41 family peptidase n=1 Tax=Pseudomonas aeruginosa TaxID=287 RepID=UPI0034A07203